MKNLFKQMWVKVGLAMLALPTTLAHASQGATPDALAVGSLKGSADNAANFDTTPVGTNLSMGSMNAVTAAGNLT